VPGALQQLPLLVLAHLLAPLLDDAAHVESLGCGDGDARATRSKPLRVEKERGRLVRRMREVNRGGALRASDAFSDAIDRARDSVSRAVLDVSTQLHFPSH
jgi:hypothetical protein